MADMIRDWNFYTEGAPGGMTDTSIGQHHLWFGQDDVDIARSRGASNYQLWQLWDRAQREHREQVAANWWGQGTGPQGQASTEKGGAGRYALGIGIGLQKGFGPRPVAPGGHVFENYDNTYGMGMGSLLSQGTLDEQIALRDFAVQHGLTIGSGVNEHIQSGLEKRDADEREARSLAHEQKLADEEAARDAERLAQEAAFQQELLAQQEAAAAKARRVTGSSPTGVGGVASIKGSRLSITEAGGRKGTRRFARPSTQWLQTMGIGNNTSTKDPVSI